MANLNEIINNNDKPLFDQNKYKKPEIYFGLKHDKNINFINENNGANKINKTPNPNLRSFEKLIDSRINFANANKNNYNNNKNNDINNNNNISLFYIFDEQTIINDIIENKNKLIIALNNSEINIIDIKDKNVNKLLGHSKSVIFVKYYDINTIISSSIDSEIRIWNINKLLCTYVIKDYENDEGWILSLLRINNGLIFCGYSNGFFKVYNYE